MPGNNRRSRRTRKPCSPRSRTSRTRSWRTPTSASAIARSTKRSRPIGARSNWRMNFTRKASAISSTCSRPSGRCIKPKTNSWTVNVPLPPIWSRCTRRSAAAGRTAMQWFRRSSLLLIVIAVGCSRSNGKTTSGPPPAPVTVATATTQDVPVVVHAIGNVRAFSMVMVKPRIDGRLEKVGFKEGDEVKQGDLLFELDPRALQAALDQAEGNLAKDVAAWKSAEADWQRAKELENTKAMSASALDQARAKADGLKAQVEADRAAVENAKVQLSYCFIHSPIDGRISTLGANAGNVLKNNDTLLATVNQIKPI